jgi:thioredoxin reductase (NADPH)
MTSKTDTYDVVIIGAGPAGLAAAIAAKQHGLSYLVLERAALVNSLLHYPDDMMFFTTPELMEIGGMPFVSPNDKPSRREALRYYRRVTDAFGLEIALQELVTGLKRSTDSTFRVTSEPAHRERVTRSARFVILAAGAYDVPNALGIPGEDLPHVSHYYRNPHFHYRQRVVIVGGKNSAAEAALDLYRSGSQVLMVHRGEALGDSIKYWVKPDIENRIKEGSIHARFNTRVTGITPTHVTLEGPDGRSEERADAVLLLTGYKSNPVLLRDVGAAMNPETGAPVHNAETYETTVQNLFVIGAFVAGKQSGQIFIENGRFHGQVVIAEITQRRGQKRS